MVIAAVVMIGGAGTLSAAVWLAGEVGLDPQRTIPLMVSDADLDTELEEASAAVPDAEADTPAASEARTSESFDNQTAASAPVVVTRQRSPAPAAERVGTDRVEADIPDARRAAGPAKVRVDRPTFNGRPIRAVKRMTMLVTAYSPDERSCGIHADGITASGYSVWTNGMKLVAADTRLLPFGSIVSIPGYHGGKPVPVLDRGGKIKGHRLDVLYPTHEIALEWGAQRLEVVVWEYAD